MTTICQQTQCYRCCINTNMFLSKKDIRRIIKFGYEKDFFVREKNGWMQLKNSNKRCVFHTGTSCLIYLDRPEGCSLYPVVYDQNKQRAILDSECPQWQVFEINTQNVRQLSALISILKEERKQQKNQTKLKNRSNK